MKQSIIRGRARENPKANKILIAKLHRQIQNLKTKLADCPNPNKLATISNPERGIVLRQHRSMILEFLGVFGDEETQRVLCCSHDTLERLIRGGQQPFNPSFTKIDKVLAMAEINKAGLAEARQEVKELKEQYATFTEAVSQKLGNDLKLAIATALERTIEVPASLEIGLKPDPLNVANLIEQLGSKK